MMPTGRNTRQVVLIADDDDGTRYILAETLAHEGYRVIQTSCGQEAVDAFLRSSPDVVLLDVEMPGLDGYGACKAIRENASQSDIPVVMVTSNDDSESINRAYDVGATDFISKPINWSLIGHRLRYILRGASHLRSLAASESKNRALITAIPDQILTIDYDGVVLDHISPGGKNRNTLDSRNHLRGKRLTDVLTDCVEIDVVDAIKALRLTGKETTFEFVAQSNKADPTWFECRLIPQNNGRILAISRDISERKQAADKIYKLAFYNQLTGLPNRACFRDQLQRLVASAQDADSRLAIFSIDLNRFKRINDALGSVTGDEVLCEMATRLKAAVEKWTRQTGLSDEDCCLACFGGDEFALVVPNPPPEEGMTTLADLLRTTSSRPLTIRGHEFVVTSSIGIAGYPQHGATAEVLMKHAESARNEARQRGRDTQAIYRRSMSSGVYEGLNLENELRRALENDELTVFYQPKYCTRTPQQCGAEALLRWDHPVRGHISPAAFVPIAEESGLISDLGSWVARNVCQQISLWDYLGVEPGPIAINLSGQEFGLGNPIATLTDAVRDAGISASAVELEITETVLMSDIRSVMRALHTLREEGFTIAVDDFGTGYSSLRYLQRFPVDVLKIDYSFVRHVEKDADTRAICTAIIAMAHSLGLKVVGEGVENQWQLDFLRQEGCDMVQGFLMSKPICATEFTNMLQDKRPHSDGAERIVRLPLRKA